MVLQTQVGLNKHQSYSHEQNYYSDSSHGQMMRPSGYSHNSHMMMGHGGQHHGGYYGSHGHGHGHYGSYGHHGHMPHDSTTFSSSTAMVHNDGGYGSGMQQSSHAHMSSSMAMGHHGHGGSHPSGYSQSQKFNWALKNLDD